MQALSTPSSSSKKTVFKSSTWTPMDVEKFISQNSLKKGSSIKVPKCQICSKETRFNEETIYWETMLFCNHKCFRSYDDLITCFRSFKRTFNMNSVGHYCQENIGLLDRHIKKFEEKSSRIENIGFCATCLTDKQVSYDLMRKPTDITKARNANKSIKFCSENCMTVFKRLHSLDIIKCSFCSSYFDLEFSDHVIYSKAQIRSFCSRPCLGVFFMKFRSSVVCDACSQKKHNFNMIERVSSEGVSQYHCSYSCLKMTLPLNEVELERNDSEDIVLSTQQGPSIIQKPITKLINPAHMKNKISSATPLYKSQGTSTHLETRQESTQTVKYEEEDDKGSSGKSTVYPFALPFYVPLPMRMYSTPYPVPLPLPLYVPVPIFIPVKESSFQGIKDKIHELNPQKYEEDLFPSSMTEFPDGSKACKEDEFYFCDEPSSPIAHIVYPDNAKMSCTSIEDLEDIESSGDIGSLEEVSRTLEEEEKKQKESSSPQSAPEERNDSPPNDYVDEGGISS
eukprot:TRINITY_DN5783_c0_g1_i3.p1 TRINITY_DN5783_c0_g1~~TRINITY_DN5783_c0_g1_i3.p1  ORF type:complete len:509 (+),score=116.98 TRINITY_DN5783_c0_g1_i3:201-1727(+)